jgi:alpha/beta hydrolase fold
MAKAMGSWAFSPYLARKSLPNDGHHGPESGVHGLYRSPACRRPCFGYNAGHKQFSVDHDCACGSSDDDNDHATARRPPAVAQPALRAPIAFRAPRPVHARPCSGCLWSSWARCLRPRRSRASRRGDKANSFSLTLVNFFLSLGYAAASIDYRSSNEAHFPAQIEDVKTAVRWLRAHAATYGYNPDAMTAVGDSAGVQLVALLGASEGVAALEGSELGYPQFSSAFLEPEAETLRSALRT